MIEFVLSPDADTVGCSLSGYIRVAPATLVEVFGEPGPGDEYKVSGEYVFSIADESGEVLNRLAGGRDKVVTIYDWKATSLYDGEDPEPSEFWSRTFEWEFHIGSRDRVVAEQFIPWLEARLGETLNYRSL